MRDWITLAVEGRTDEAVGRRLLAHAGIEVGPVYGLRGKHHLDEKLPAYNSAARFSPWLVLRDLNTDESCAPALVVQLLASPAPAMRLHIVVRAIEAWLLADHETLSEFIGIRSRDVPADPEDIPKPKLALVELARRSKRRTVRDGIVPASGSTAKVGPGYTTLLTEFATRVWRPEIAVKRSASLDRLLRYFHRLGRQDGEC